MCLDLVSYLPGIDSTVTRYLTNCNRGGFSELWTILDGTHSNMFSDTFSRQVVEFFYANPDSVSDIIGVPASPWGPVPLVACLLLLGAISVRWVALHSPN